MKKIILIVSAIVVAGLIGGGIYLFTQSQTNSETSENTSQVGSPVDLANTPNYAACEIITQEDLRAIMQNGIVNIEDGARSGIVSPNTNIAEECRYTFSTPQSSDNSLVVQIYNVSADEDNQADILDASWSMDTDADLPSYYKLIENNDGVVNGYLRVFNGGQIIQWTFEQPVDAQQFTYSDIRYILFALSERADYTLLQETILEENDIEPAPQN